MKNWSFLIILLLLFNCKKKENLSDGVTFSYDKSILMKFQEFNEGLDAYGGNLVYAGKPTKSINVKSYPNSYTPQPLPYPENRTKVDINRKTDSLIEKYFNKHLDIKMVKGNSQFDSITNKDVKIEVLSKDTIPTYRLDIWEGRTLKIYKSTPIFVKNISNKNLLILSDNVDVFYEILLPNGKWRFIQNNRWFIDGVFSDNMYPSFLFKKDSLLVFGIPYLHGKQKIKMRIRFMYAFSEPFDAFIDPSILDQQRLYQVR